MIWRGWRIRFGWPVRLTAAELCEHQRQDNRDACERARLRREAEADEKFRRAFILLRRHRERRP